MIFGLLLRESRASNGRGSKSEANRRQNCSNPQELEVGVSSILVAAMKYGYMTFNPARGAGLPPEEIKEQKKLPTGN
jgi:hypothetical protein